MSKPTTLHGKWLASTNDERWTSGEEFDTREDAEAYGRESLAIEENFEDGRDYYTGQVDLLTPLEMAAVLDGESILEELNAFFYEQFGDHLNYELKVSKAQTEDLEVRLRVAMAAWFEDHDLRAPSYRIEHVQSHEWKQCSEKEDAQCVLWDGHPEAHEYV